MLGISNSRMTAERLEEDEVSLTDIIDSLGRKQRVIAEKTGFSENKVSQTLNGRRVISAEELEIYCNALKITPNDIYQFNGCRESQ